MNVVATAFGVGAMSYKGYAASNPFVYDTAPARGQTDCAHDHRGQGREHRPVFDLKLAAARDHLYEHRDARRRDAARHLSQTSHVRGLS